MPTTVNAGQSEPEATEAPVFRRALARARELTPQGTRVGVAVSGGPDSVFLLEVHASLAHLRRDPRPTVLHIDHGWRGDESRADARFTRELADHYELPFAEVTLKAGRHSEDHARRARYAALSDLARERSLEAIAVGHHRDDQIETLLLRLLRGTGVRGLAGMPAERPLRNDRDTRLIRPLLEIDATEIRSWLEEHGRGHRFDATNRDPRYARNAVRHELIPMIEDRLGKDWRVGLLGLAASARLLSATLREQARRVLAAAGPTAERRLPIEDYWAAPAVLRREILLTWCEEILEEHPAPELSLDPIDAFIAHSATHHRWSLGAGLELVVQYGALRVRRPTTRAVFDVPVVGPGRLEVVGGTLEIQEWDHAPDVFEDSHTEWIDADSAPFPWRLRSRRPGDRFRPLGMTGRRKVKDFLSDRKLTDEERQRILILECAEGPIWIVGERLDHRCRVREETRRWLRLSFVQA